MRSRDPLRPRPRLGQIDKRPGLGLGIEDLSLGVGLGQLGLVHIPGGQKLCPFFLPKRLCSHVGLFVSASVFVCQRGDEF